MSKESGEAWAISPVLLWRLLLRKRVLARKKVMFGKISGFIRLYEIREKEFRKF